MRMLRVIFAVLLMIVALSSFCVAQQYTVTDLGVLPGGPTSTALAINDNGQVAGCATTAAFLCRAFVWSSSRGMIVTGPIFCTR
jgi:probable HAF family extracellular repeat protein